MTTQNRIIYLMLNNAQLQKAPIFRMYDASNLVHFREVNVFTRRLRSTNGQRVPDFYSAQRPRGWTSQHARHAGPPVRRHSESQSESLPRDRREADAFSWKAIYRRHASIAISLLIAIALSEHETPFHKNASAIATTTSRDAGPSALSPASFRVNQDRQGLLP